MFPATSDSRSRSRSPGGSESFAASAHSSRRRDDRAFLDQGFSGGAASSAGRLEPELRAVIKRHVIQVDAHNRYLEKRQMWSQHEKDEEERARKKRESHGIFARDYDGDSEDLRMPHRKQPRPTRSFKEDEGLQGRPGGASMSLFDVHAAERLLNAREKEKKRLKQITGEDGDHWRPDKFYTDELQTEKPWINPYDVMARNLLIQPSEGELTPKADSTSSSSASRKRDKAKKKSKKKLNKEKKKLKKKLKKLKS
ncbi:conserved hypothetical protein [Neospora caninum Liverpool]|uniref:Uncharacterized protein n=1 Tax=Neospora caninum (strain Liverpool) TaxID=572307 RepID=F0VGF4_NEOCL|nr:conserved hypothetical protein [Neospora caninum Liverpool]CBZ52798.1 conserved hypothetical protein [Neospora caninum Liverpool]CEL66780.1 TPA: hypothetical protein BN1204_025870 [Neospora caninum Liverpool]|eukprot:XP_003882830.1 conserved hypothetical protein [Neospora caninum Liverpool]